jgi:hypothetical protein
VNRTTIPQIKGDHADDFGDYIQVSLATLSIIEERLRTKSCKSISEIQNNQRNPGLTHEELFEELKALAAELGIKLRFENGNFDGGYCLLREERLLVLNRRATVPKKIRTLARGLSEYGLGSVFIRPALREAIEDEIAKEAKESA